MTGSPNFTDRFYTAYCWVGVAFGAAMVLTSRPFLRAYNFDDHSAESLHLTRLTGTRTATLGVVGLLATSPADRRRAATAVLVWHTTDTVLGALSSRSITTRARITSTLTSAASATGAALYLQRSTTTAT